MSLWGGAALVLAMRLFACGGDPTDPVPADASTDVGSDADPAALRAACAFGAGALPRSTLGGVPAKIPIEHVIVLMQENRSFDHYLGRHPKTIDGTMDGFPAGYTNPVDGGAPRAPVHATTTCLSPDPPHDWDATHRAWNGGAMNGFYAEGELLAPGGGKTALSYYAPDDIPFYTWLYGTFASSDRFFCSTLGPTAPNRKYLITATSNGTKAAQEPVVGVQRSIYDALRDAKVSYLVYNPELYDVPSAGASAVRTLGDFFTDLASGSLPTIAFLNAAFANSEHPPRDIHGGEVFVRDVVVALGKSPAWSTSALILTYDEAGGFFDHVPPPAACPPDGLPENAEFDRLGIRVPFVVVSPYARRAFVSHETHSHTSITRFIELLAGVGALTKRDANSDALLDLFDFGAGPTAMPDEGSIPKAGPSTCGTADAGTDAATDAPAD